MKKIVSFVLALSFLFVASPAHAIYVYLDNEPLHFDTEPVLQDGRTLVPMRAIFESFGYDVYYDDGEIVASNEAEDTVLFLTVNEPFMSVCSYAAIDEPLTYDPNYAYTQEYADYLYNLLMQGLIEIDVPPTIYNSRTLVPLRVISETLGCSVAWDGPSQSVYIDRY